MKEVKYKRMNQEEKDMIFKLFEEKMELRKIARVMNRSLSSIQYQLNPLNKHRDLSICTDTIK